MNQSPHEREVRRRRRNAAEEIELCEQQLLIGKPTKEERASINERMERMRRNVEACDVLLQEYDRGVDRGW